jgi:hypothetical protein
MACSAHVRQHRNHIRYKQLDRAAHNHEQHHCHENMVERILPFLRLEFIDRVEHVTVWNQPRYLATVRMGRYSIIRSNAISPLARRGMEPRKH